MRICSVENCGKKHDGHGLCKKHNKQRRTHGRVGEELRARTDRAELDAFIRETLLSNTDECIEWPFVTTNNGYGRIGIDGVDMRAHRYILALFTGSMPDGKVLCLHKPVICHNRGCVNPRHLYWGSHQQNMNDKAAEDAAPVHIDYGITP